MNERLDKWSKGFASIDFVLFSMAEELVRERLTESWKDFTYPENYLQQNRAGKHPSTFKGFLEGHSWQLRQMGYPCSAGDLQELMDIYAALAPAGLTPADMAFLSAKVLKALYKQHRDSTSGYLDAVRDALSIKQTTGQYYLPSFDQPGVIKYSLETRRRKDGRISLVGFNSIRDGVAHRNFFEDDGELRYFLKRVRASHIELPEETE